MSESDDFSPEQEQPKEDSISIAEVRASLSRVATSAEVNLLLAESLCAIAIDPTVSFEEREKALAEYHRIAETTRIKGETLLEVEEDLGLNRVD